MSPIMHVGRSLPHGKGRPGPGTVPGPHAGEHSETSCPKALMRSDEVAGAPFQAGREADTRFRSPSIEQNFKKVLLKAKPCHSSCKLFLIGK